MATEADRLHKSILHALHDLKWESLRELQTKTIKAWFDGADDLLIMANTASGKTEAAFLPLLSEIADSHGAGSVRILYIGPLKALINDQFRRVEELCDRAKIPVHRWHGDVSASDKHKVISKPAGVLLITPESLEAFFILRGREMRRIFSQLRAVVIDELHSFLESERGRQLNSQMTRLDLVRAGSARFRRIGLSATIGEPDAAKVWLSNGHPERVTIIESHAKRSVELVVKTIIQQCADSDGEQTGFGLLGVARHVLAMFSGSTNLFFANRKADLEIMADLLGRLCDSESLANSFMVHHGSLSKSAREYVEAELQSGRPCTALCSSTLEMGIDVGSVDAVGQLYAPSSVSSLKQRLGRSGRRAGSASRLWLYVPVEKCGHDADLSDHLYPDLLQAVAMVELLLEKWVEPPFISQFDLSTLIQQILSSIVQYGGAKASILFDSLCTKGAFRLVRPELFIALLRDLGKAELVEQTAQGDLILGLKGEELVRHYDFYSAFFSPDEYGVYDGGFHIGKIGMPLTPYLSGDYILLAGRRWEVIAVDHRRLAIQVRAGTSQQPVCWRGSRGSVHGKIREKMRTLACRADLPAWLNKESIEVLRWSRSAATECGLDKGNWISNAEGLWLFTWTSDRANNTMHLEMRSRGLDCVKLDNGLGFKFTGAGKDKVSSTLENIATAPTDPTALVLDVFDENLPLAGKHSVFLSRELQAQAYGSMELDHNAMLEAIERLLGENA